MRTDEKHEPLFEPIEVTDSCSKDWSEDSETKAWSQNLFYDQIWDQATETSII